MIYLFTQTNNLCFRDSSANLEKEGKVSSLMNDHKSKVMNSIHWKKESRQLFIFVDETFPSFSKFALESLKHKLLVWVCIIC
jgi:hypothetical protein